ncbi:MAG: hypothetical protein WCD24_07350, partial [Serratia inhibens]|uniref:hypothetical protein n=1 Tax=Serratia inhibens TaxID=2338073 RepID=UPI003C7B6422
MDIIRKPFSIEREWKCDTHHDPGGERVFYWIYITYFFLTSRGFDMVWKIGFHEKKKKVILLAAIM